MRFSRDPSQTFRTSRLDRVVAASPGMARSLFLRTRQPRLEVRSLRCEEVGKKSASKAGSFQSSGPDPKKTRTWVRENREKDCLQGPACPVFWTRPPKTRTWRPRSGTQVRRNRDPTMHFLRRPLETHTHDVLRRAGQSALLARKPWIYTYSSGGPPTFRTLGFLLHYCSLEIRT